MQTTLARHLIGPKISLYHTTTLITWPHSHRSVISNEKSKVPATDAMDPGKLWSQSVSVGIHEKTETNSSWDRINDISVFWRKQIFKALICKGFIISWVVTWLYFVHDLHRNYEICLLLLGDWFFLYLVFPKYIQTLMNVYPFIKENGHLKNFKLTKYQEEKYQNQLVKISQCFCIAV